MLHIVAAIKQNSRNITHLKVFDGYSMRIYDIATFVMLWAYPEYKSIEPHTSIISGDIQNNDAHIHLTKEGIVLEGYSDLPILNEKGRVLHPGRVIFSEAGKQPVKAIKSGFKEVQCSPKDIEKKLVCNLAEYSGMLGSSEYIIKWEDCDSRYEILFPEMVSARCLLSGFEYSKNRINIYACETPTLNILDKGILVDSSLQLRLEDTRVEQIVLPIAAKNASIELINCPKLKQIICPYGTTSVKISGVVDARVLRNTLLTTDIANKSLERVLAVKNAVGVSELPQVIRAPELR